MKKDNKMKNIRNRFIAIISLLLFITTPIQAQVFIMDEDQVETLGWRKWILLSPSHTRLVIWTSIFLLAKDCFCCQDLEPSIC